MCLQGMKHLGILKNSFKRVRAFQIELEFGVVGFWVGRKTGLFPKKNLLEQEREPTKKLMWIITYRVVAWIYAYTNLGVKVRPLFKE